MYTAEGSSFHSCTKIAIVDGQLTDATSSGNTDDLLKSSASSGSDVNEFSLCVKRSRERRLYTSTGHVVTVYTMTSVPSSVALGQSRVVAPATDTTRFLLMYRRERYHTTIWVLFIYPIMSVTRLSVLNSSDLV